MCRRWNRWVIVFAVLSINFAGIKISAFAANCLSAVNAPGCAYGLPADQYNQLLAVMAANPAPNGHPLPVDVEGVKKYTATTGGSPHLPSSFTRLLFHAPPPLPMGWLLRKTPPLPLPRRPPHLTN